MTIRQHERVHYEKTPLVEVICQLSFARVEEIAVNGPTKFLTDLFVITYPKHEEQRVVSIQVSEAIETSAEMRSTDIPISDKAVPAVYHFTDTDDIWKVSLCANFLAISCSRYSRWEDFKERINFAITTYANAYGFPHLVKIGLRYKDVIEREPLGLSGVPWKDLLAPFVTGCFAAKELFTSEYDATCGVEQQNTQSLFNLKKNKVLLQTALLHSVEDPKQQAFLIDADFFLDVLDNFSLDPLALETTLQELHSNAGALFRNCIQEKLHVALAPRRI